MNEESPDCDHKFEKTELQFAHNVRTIFKNYMRRIIKATNVKQYLFIKITTNSPLGKTWILASNHYLYNSGQQLKMENLAEIDKLCKF